MVSALRHNVVVILRALGIWLAMLIAAIVNGAAREAWLLSGFGDRDAHIVSSIMLSAVILLITKVTLPWIGPATTRQALAIGALWLALTMGFEFLAGHYVFGHSWSRLLADYDILAGRIWALVLLTTALAPVVWHTRVTRIPG